mgnify:CR=1 FL=1
MRFAAACRRCADWLPVRIVLRGANAATRALLDPRLDATSRLCTGRISAMSRLCPRLVWRRDGTSGSRMYACANDMIFVCPRALCRPYFELLELWTSPHCTPASWPQVAPSERWGVAAAVGINAKGRAVLPARTIFADERTGAPNGMSGPPTEPYWLPPKPKKMDVHYYFYARYSDGEYIEPRSQVRQVPST